MKNPKPEFTEVVARRDHIKWQEGYDAKEKEDQGLYEALREARSYLESRPGKPNPKAEKVLWKLINALHKVGG